MLFVRFLFTWTEPLFRVRRMHCVHDCASGLGTRGGLGRGRGKATDSSGCTNGYSAPSGFYGSAGGLVVTVRLVNCGGVLGRE